MRRLNPFKAYLVKFPPVGWMVLLLLILFSITVPDYFAWDNISNILIQSVPLLIVAFAQTLVILTEGIDLSLGAMVSFCTVSWMMLAKAGVPLIAGALISVALTTAVGVFNGFIVGTGKMPPFIATLGTQNIVNGITLLITGGASVYFSSYVFQFVTESTVLFIPLPVCIAAVMFAISWIVLYRTKLGVNIVGLGGNSESLSLAGISISKNLIKTYAFAGLLSGIAGLLTACRVESGQPTVGSGMEFEAMAAALLGGTSFIEGKGGLAGTIFGVFLIEILRNGMNMAGVSAIYQSALIGFIVLGAIVLDCYIRRYQTDWRSENE